MCAGSRAAAVASPAVRRRSGVPGEDDPRVAPGEQQRERAIVRVAVPAPRLGAAGGLRTSACTPSPQRALGPRGPAPARLRRARSCRRPDSRRTAPTPPSWSGWGWLIASVSRSRHAQAPQRRDHDALAGVVVAPARAGVVEQRAAAGEQHGGGQPLSDIEHRHEQLLPVRERPPSAPLAIAAAAHAADAPRAAERGSAGAAARTPAPAAKASAAAAAARCASDRPRRQGEPRGDIDEPFGATRAPPLRRATPAGAQSAAAARASQPAGSTTNPVNGTATRLASGPTSDTCWK